MTKEIVNYDNIILPELERFSVRTKYLEDLSYKNKRYIEMKALQWDSTVSELRREVSRFRLELKNLKTQLLDVKSSFINLVNNFKETALDEDYRKLKRTIDDWNIDKFITKKEFESMLKDS